MQENIEAKINKATVFICPYCCKEYNSEHEVKQCLNDHNIIFAIYKYKYSCDCWGRADGEYENINMFFKKYEDAEDYIKSHKDCKIYIHKLN